MEKTGDFRLNDLQCEEMISYSFLNNKFNIKHHPCYGVSIKEDKDKNLYLRALSLTQLVWAMT